jgi:hypothetical protein
MDASGLRLNNVVVTGAATGAAAPPPATVSAKAFESARAAAEQRAATSLAAADESDMAKSAGVRRVGSRTFALRGDTWVDTRKTDSMQVTKVRAFSEAYFKLIEAIPELREVFALGDKVIVAGKGIAVATGDDGVATVDEAKLRQIQERMQ